MTENVVSGQVVDAAIEVHRELGGPGLLESVYEEALLQELRLRGFNVKNQVAVPIQYKGVGLRSPLRLDLLVEDRVIVEVKACEKDHAVHRAQLMTYLRLTGLKLGLVLNFGLPRLVEGVTRTVNNL